MVGAHPSMLRLYDGIGRAAPLAVPVLVQGPTGAGKELVAQALHALSGRRGPIVPVNVGTIPEQLAESELFGAVRGAYTGSTADRVGLIESAHGGTLLLDEAAELSHATQVRLLRVLETGSVRPVGGSTARNVEFRLILCTQEVPGDLVATGRWREDFYYRVAGIVLRVPSLEERESDLKLLADYLLDQCGHPPLPPGAGAELASRAWPGNVRQLRRAVERAAFDADGRQVSTLDIIQAAAAFEPPGRRAAHSPRDGSLRAVERQHIERVLRECGYHTKAAAVILGLSVGRLYRKYRELDITPPRQR